MLSFSVEASAGGGGKEDAWIHWTANRIDDLQLALARLDSLVELVEKTVENVSNEEFISMKQQVTSQVNEICRKCRCLELTPAELVNFKTVMPQATS